MRLIIMLVAGISIGAASNTWTDARRRTLIAFAVWAGLEIVLFVVITAQGQGDAMRLAGYQFADILGGYVAAAIGAASAQGVRRLVSS